MPNRTAETTKRQLARRKRFRLHRSDQAGVFAAVGGTAMTFQRSLMPRSTRDQAIVTGATMGVMYLAASLLHDAVESAASFVLTGGSKRHADEDKLRRLSLLADLAVMGGGIGAQRLLRQTAYESPARAGVRTAAFWFTAASFAGLSAGLTEETIDSLDDRTGHRYHIDKLPVALLSGAAFAAVREFQRRRKESVYTADDASELARVSGSRALAMGAGVGAGLAAFSLGNRALSRIIGRSLDRLFPGDERLWRPMAHLTNAAILGAALYAVWYRVTHRIEEGTGKIEAAFDRAPESPLISGSEASLVSWETIGREGRRHVSTVLPKQWIENIMGEPAMSPIRVFAGLDSAPTEEDRVNLVLAELERAGAFERSLLLVTSPTGTGYVNYVAVESAEYFTRGNCATATIQYSKRPSPMSLDRVWEGRKQFRMLLAAIRRKLYTMPPEKRPRLVVFGESLGAHTSQDAFIHSGTQGLQDAGVERALWIGTPHLSKWKVQVTGKPRPDVERSLIGEFNSFDEVESLPAAARKQLRYFLVTHGNDGVARFGLDLLIQQPDWLGDPDHRPVGVPRTQKWITPTTFFQTLIDMNNAMSVVPGQFDANGHDYRGDLARFVREAFGLECTDEQMERVEGALRRYELVRQARMIGRPGVETPAGDGTSASPSASSA
jgi:uncharacterized membrane protein